MSTALFKQAISTRERSWTVRPIAFHASQRSVYLGLMAVLFDISAISRSAVVDISKSPSPSQACGKIRKQEEADKILSFYLSFKRCLHAFEFSLYQGGFFN